MSKEAQQFSSLSPELAQAVSQEVQGAMQAIYQNPGIAAAQPSIGLSGYTGTEPGVIGAAIRHHAGSPPAVPGGQSAAPTLAPQVPAAQQPGAQAVPETVPYERLAQVVAEKNEAAKKAEALAQEIQSLRTKLRDKELTSVVGQILDKNNLPEDFTDWSYEQQEQWKLAKLLEVVESRRPEAPAVAPDLDERLMRLELAERFGKLSREQADYLMEIRKTRNPQSDKEWLVLAQVNRPDLFVGAEANQPPASHQVLPPGRGQAPTEGEPSVFDIANAMAEQRHNQGEVNRLGATFLEKLAETNPGLLFNGR